MRTHSKLISDALDMKRDSKAEVLPQRCFSLTFFDSEVEDAFQQQQYMNMRKPVQVLIIVRLILNLIAPAYTVTLDEAKPFQKVVLTVHHSIPILTLTVLSLLPKLCTSTRMQAVVYRWLLVLQVLGDTCLECALAGSNTDPFPAGPFIVACGAALARLGWLDVTCLSAIACALYWLFYIGGGNQPHQLSIMTCIAGFPLMWIVSRFCDKSLREDFWSRRQLTEFNEKLRNRFKEFTASATANNPPHPLLERMENIANCPDDCSTMRQLLDTLELAHDVNELIVLSEQRQSLFLSTMSHELRTPLTAMLGAVQMLNVQKDDVELVDSIKESGDNLLIMVNNILDYSRLAYNNMSIKLEQTLFCPRTSMNRLARMTEMQCRLKGLEFIYDINNLSPGIRIQGDELRLAQIVTNLLSNAVKFTDRAGTVTLEIRDVRISNDSCTPNGSPGHDDTTSWALRIRVHDTGIGMTAKTIEKIFTPFTQADGSITRRFGGTGLGLTIANHYARLMKSPGIRVDSVDGVFSEFTVEIPVFRLIDKHAAVKDASNRRNATMHDSVESERLKKNKNIKSGVRLLVVDDVSAIRKTIVRQLAKLGYENVDLADDGTTAINAVHAAMKKGQPFQGIFMDFHMPNVDGIQATETIMAVCKKQSPVIIGVTADVTGKVIHEFHNAGAVSVLHKPLTLTALLASLKSVEEVSDSWMGDGNMDSKF